MSQLEELEIVNKVMRVETLKNATESISRIYLNVKSSNGIITFWFTTAEKGCVLVYDGVKPIIRVFDAPIKMADFCACSLFDTVQQNVFPVLEVPVETLKSGGQRLLNSSLGQFILSSADIGLRLAENTVTLLPGISVTGENISDNGDGKSVNNDSGMFEPIKKIYGIAMTPVKMTGKLIHASRGIIEQYKKPNTEFKTSPSTESKRIGLIARLVRLPVRGFHFIGMLAEKRSILYRQKSYETEVSAEKSVEQIESVEKEWQVLDADDHLEPEVMFSPSLDKISEESSDEESAVSQPAPPSAPIETIPPPQPPQVKRKLTPYAKPNIVKPIKPLGKTSKTNPKVVKETALVNKQRKTTIVQTAPLDIKRVTSPPSSRNVRETRKSTGAAKPRVSSE